jgi:hypothetical protein
MLPLSILELSVVVYDAFTIFLPWEVARNVATCVLFVLRQFHTCCAYWLSVLVVLAVRFFLGEFTRIGC